MTSHPRFDTIRLPLTGRERESAVLREALDRAAAGSGGTVFVEGPMGTGKSRLMHVLADEARGRGFRTSLATSFPLESGIPYSVFRDLLHPLVEGESEDRLLVLTRGAPEFSLLIPQLEQVQGEQLEAVESIPDLRARLLWNFPDFLDRLRSDRPLLLLVEDIEWADPSSLELLHFLARQARRFAILLIVSWDASARISSGTIPSAVRALEERGDILRIPLEHLSPNAVVEAVSGGCGLSPEVVRTFALKLHRWTGGNPLYIVSTLNSLVASGHLRREDGRWTGWEVNDLPAPGEIRDQVLEPLFALPSEAREVAELIAVSGIQSPVRLLETASGVETAAFEDILAELVRIGLLLEVTKEGEVAVEFRHPIVREALLGEIGKARARRLHLAIFRAFEEIHGDRSMDRALEIAPQVIGAGTEVDPLKGSEYLWRAGRASLSARADREALTFLRGALALLERTVEGSMAVDRRLLSEDLARAQQRLGYFSEAIAILTEARASALERGDLRAAVGLDRRLALSAFWGGRPEEGLLFAEQGILGAREAGDLEMEVRLRLVASACLRDLGRGDEARAEGESALRASEVLGDDRLRLSAHRNLLLYHTWAGPVGRAREHGSAAIAIGEVLGDRKEAFQAHWAMAVLGGVTGDLESLHRHLAEANRLADLIGSPLLRLQVVDIQIELATSRGDWTRGVDLSAEAIRMARELNQRMLLPRLLVWSSLLHLGRGEIESARREMEEAWTLTGGEDDASAPGVPHLRILVHAGQAALLVAEGRYAEAIAVGERGLELVDTTGYRAWAIHRLLPTIVEAALHLRDLPTARKTAKRLREEAEWFGHPVGLIWADAGDALVAWIGGDVREGARQMASAAERLEGVQVIPDAARLRRQLAGRLAELGERDAAIRELRRVHDTLAALGATPELDKARGQFREVGARPPIRSAAPGAGLLTAREMEIARLIAQRRSNKSIGKELGISARTVSTHLTSIFRKLGIGSRGELLDLVRDGRTEVENLETAE